MFKTTRFGSVAALATGIACSATLAQSESTPASASSARADWEAISATFAGSKSSTRPDREVIIGFPIPVTVSEIIADGGATIESGDLLARARDGDVVAAIAQQQLRCDSTVAVDSAEKSREFAEFRYTSLVASDQGSEVEKRERKLLWDQAVLELEQARLNHQEQSLLLDQLQERHRQYRLDAPFDGIIEEVMIEVGQAVRETDPGIRIVNIDRLKLDAYADTNDTMRLELDAGDPAWILIDLPDEPAMVKGVVKYVSPLAHAASRWRRVRVEMENPNRWPAGTPARVRFTAPPESFDQYAMTVPETGGSAHAQPMTAPVDAQPTDARGGAALAQGNARGG